MTCYLAVALGFMSTLGACDASNRNPVPGVASLSAAVTDDSSATRIRRVVASAGDYSAPSPDGRLITFVDWSTGDVAIRDLAAGEDRRITDKGTWEQNGSWAEEPLFSPNGKQIVYTYGNVQTGDPFLYELRMVNVGDTTQHLLYSDERDMWFQALSWSTYGIVLEINRGEKAAFITELSVMNPEDRSLRVLRTYKKDDAHPHGAFFSPDGRVVAVQAAGELQLIAANGGDTRPVDVPIKALLGWTPDGRYVLVHAARQGVTGIWAVPISNMRQSGAPVLVRGGLPGIVPGGFAGSAYFYALPVDAPKVHVMSVDLAGGRVLAPAVALTSAVDGMAMNPTWSPDGRTLAYTLSSATGGGFRVMLRAAEGDELRELADLNRGQVRQFFWHPNGQALYARVNGNRGFELQRIDVRSGTVTEMSIRNPNGGAAITPDGRSVVYARYSPKQKDLISGILHHDIATGRERTIRVVPQELQALSISPDGQHIVYVLPSGQKSSQLLMEPITGGEQRVLIDVALPLHLEGRGVRALPWTADGKYILIQRGDADKWHELMALPVAGGEPISLLKFDGPQLHHPTLHPDGRRIAYSSQGYRQELWILDEFLDKLK